MRLAHDAKAEKWAADRIPGCERGFGNCRAFFVLDDKPIAGVVFHNWQPECGVIEVSAAAESPRWATRSVFSDLMAYAFDKCGCQLVVARISVNNRRARRLWRAFGATEYVVPRLRGRNESEAILTLPDDVWAKSKMKR